MKTLPLLYLRCLLLPMLFLLGGWIMGVGQAAQAQSYHVTMNTTGLNGLAGILAFDLTQGDVLASNNTVSILAFTSDATLTGGGNTNSLGATGDLPGTISIIDQDFFNESSRGLVFGNTMAFDFNVSAFFASPGSPDEFSVFLLDAGGVSSLVSTSDPTGADALFTVDIDGSQAGTLTTFVSNTPGVGYQITPNIISVPEPTGAFAGLVFAGGIAMLKRGRKRREWKFVN